VIVFAQAEQASLGTVSCSVIVLNFLLRITNFLKIVE
jgi:hypothetical protein